MTKRTEPPAGSPLERRFNNMERKMIDKFDYLEARMHARFNIVDDEHRKIIYKSELHQKVTWGLYLITIALVVKIFIF